MELIRKQTYLTPVQDRAIKQLARRHGTTEAEIVRRAVDQYLAREHEEVADPFIELIGMFRGPAVADHDDIYR